jgi:hypothetical protein
VLLRPSPSGTVRLFSLPKHGVGLHSPFLPTSTGSFPQALGQMTASQFPRKEQRHTMVSSVDKRDCGRPGIMVPMVVPCQAISSLLSLARASITANVDLVVRKQRQPAAGSVSVGLAPQSEPNLPLRSQICFLLKPARLPFRHPGDVYEARSLRS